MARGMLHHVKGRRSGIAWLSLLCLLSVACSSDGRMVGKLRAGTCFIPTMWRYFRPRAVSIFTVIRRSRRWIRRLTGQGSDMVFEPDVTVTKSLTSQLGRTEFSFRGQAFVYAVDPRFNHGSFGLQMLHHIDPTHESPPALLRHTESAPRGQ